MISRFLLAGLLLLATANALAAAEAARQVTILYLDRADDPAYAPIRGYAAVHPQTIPSPYPAAEAAIADAKLVGEATGLNFELRHVTMEAGDDAAVKARALAKDDGLAAVLLDLPLEQMQKAASDLAGLALPLFNTRHRDAGLRLAACRTHLFHTMPSWDMLEDGLAQGLAKRNWKRVLVIESDDPADKSVSAAFQASAAKFGLAVVAVKSFVPGSDPRVREKNNPRLITGEADYDVVFVAGQGGDFARSLPFNTLLPRPVVGAAGLMPSAWHPYWERQGAPQLNHRLEKAAKHPVGDADWAAWAAVRAIVEAEVRGRPANAAELLPALLDPRLTLELYKGSPGSFRPWSRQLRQPVLLGTEGSVAGMAPVEGMLHRTNTLDTLGLDEPEFHCP